MAQGTTLEDVARRAVDGDREALDGLVQALQGTIYGLAVRMLWNREDAEDATQEILVRVVTRLSQFDFRSKLKTWVYRVAVNYILDVKKSAVERLHLTFDQFAEDLAEGLSADGPMDAEPSLLVEGVKIGCTLGMLQCLDRPHRIAYVLGEILDMPGPEAADALEITPDVFRKRLQHARAAVLSFMRSYCGLVSDTAACACNRRVPAALRVGRVRPESFDFAATASSFQEARAIVRQVEEARWALEVHRTSRPRARRSTSHIVWREHSMRSVTDVSERRIAMTGRSLRLSLGRAKTGPEPTAANVPDPRSVASGSLHPCRS